MTANERARLAYTTIEAFGWRIDWSHAKPVPDDAWPIDIIRRHIEAAIAERPCGSPPASSSAC